MDKWAYSKDNHSEYHALQMIEKSSELAANSINDSGRHDPLSSRTGWLKPFLLWLAITLRLIFFHVPVTILTKPMHYAWNSSGVRLAALVPEQWKTPSGAFLVVAVIVIGSFASPESQDNTRSVCLSTLMCFVTLSRPRTALSHCLDW